MPPTHGLAGGTIPVKSTPQVDQSKANFTSTANPGMTGSAFTPGDKKPVDLPKSKSHMFGIEVDAQFSSDGLKKFQAENQKMSLVTEESKAASVRGGLYRQTKPLMNESVTEREGFTLADIKQVIEQVLDEKLEAVKRDIIETIRSDQRNMHVELIRQFEIQKDILSDLLEQKSNQNNQLFAEYQRIKADFDAIRRSNF